MKTLLRVVACKDDRFEERLSSLRRKLGHSGAGFASDPIGQDVLRFRWIAPAAFGERDAAKLNSAVGTPGFVFLVSAANEDMLPIAKRAIRSAFSGQAEFAQVDLR